jgi:osmotically-inducible protein OsmY
MRFTIALLSFYFLFTMGSIDRAYVGLETAHGASTTKDKASGADKAAPTASDQAENEADRKITQQIRQAVVKDDKLSTSAHNVKIITQDGKVTLRGSVKSDSEKQQIAEKAKQVSGVKNVENLLTVKQ